MNPRRKPQEATGDDAVVRSVLDDLTVDVLRDAARQRGMPLEHLIAALLRAASERVDELLDPEE